MGGGYCAERSLAVGNSPADICLLARVGHPIAFEPDPSLRREAVRRGWEITDRITLLPRLLALPIPPGTGP